MAIRESRSLPRRSRRSRSRPRTGIGRPANGPAATTGPLCSALLLSLFALRASALVAQAPGHYAEHAVTTVAVESAGTEVARTIVRDARYAVTRRGDTLVVQALELALRSTLGDETERHDTDGFVGGRWKLVADSAGRWHTVETPFVPAALADVTDLARLMDGFFPPRPPGGLPVGTTVPGADGRRWERRMGDGVHAAYAWVLTGESDTVRVLADSVEATVHERVEERGEGRWRPEGVVDWSRRTVTLSESVVAGRVIRARVTEEARVGPTP